MKNGNILYLISLVLLTVWLIGFLGYKIGPMIHLLLAVALMMIVWRLIQTLKVIRNNEDFDKNKALK
jgi:hypothetical protein